MRRAMRTKIALLLGAAWCGALAAAAAPSPQDQTIYLEADRVDIDDKQGVSTYTGNVTLRRGVLSLKADMMTVYRTRQELQKVIAVGTPVQLHQSASETTREMSGEGRRAEYDATSGELLLQDGAKLRQERNEFTGNFIRYNVNTEVVQAGKGDSTDQRVRVVIQPEPKTPPPAR
jgi:lipopolysaccharide export system protein LptA